MIGADTSYRALLGRPWLHDYYVVPSTLHQCMSNIKLCEDRRIDGDIRPFDVHEVGYPDARYYIDPAAIAEQASGSGGTTPARGRGRGRRRNNQKTTTKASGGAGPSPGQG